MLVGIWMFWQRSEKSFFDYFEEHSCEILKAAELLQNLFSNGHPAEYAKQIKECEHRADAIIRQIIKQINTSGFILPIDREDIFSFSRSLDDVLDHINQSSEAYAEIYMLKEATPFAHHFAQIIFKGTSILKPTCEMIRKPSQHASQILQHCLEIHRLENEGDVARKESLRWLFSKLEKNEIALSNYMAWSDLYGTLEIVTDKIEDCADLAEQMVLKYS